MFENIGYFIIDFPDNITEIFFFFGVKKVKTPLKNCLESSETRVYAEIFYDILQGYPFFKKGRPEMDDFEENFFFGS